MTDLRSGLCHGPACPHHITSASMSADFCSQACQARWQAALVGVAPDGGLIAPPAESFATVTPQSRMRVSWVPQLADPAHPTAAELAGGTDLTDLVAGPIRFGSGASYQDDEDELTECTCHVSLMPPCAWCELGGTEVAVGFDGTSSDGLVYATEPTMLAVHMDNSEARFTPTGPRYTFAELVNADRLPTGHWERLDDSEYPDWRWVEGGGEVISPAAADTPQSNTGRKAEIVLRPAVSEVGEAAAQPPIKAPERSWIRRLWKWVWFRG